MYSTLKPIGILVAAGLFVGLSGTATAGLLTWIKLDEPGNELPHATNEAGTDATYENFLETDLEQSPSPGKDSAYSVHFRDHSTSPYQRINCGQDAFGASALTITMWVNLDAGMFDKDHGLASMGTWTAPGNLIFWRDDEDADGGSNNTIAALINGNRINGADGILNATGWHHVAVTWAANTTDGFKLYFDGVRTEGDRPRVSVGNETIGQQEGAKDLVLGNQQDGGGANDKDFVGFMDEVGIWTDALPASAIAGLHAGTYTPATAPIPEPSTLVLSLLALLGLGFCAWRRKRT
jgi:hypothetical protein